MNNKQELAPPVLDLLYQSFETELGGVEIYSAALECALDSELAEEWQKYLDETLHHAEILRGVLEEMGLDPDRETPGRSIVRHIGKSLCKAIHLALGADDPAAAQIVAAECVTLAETKDHANWGLLTQLSEQGHVRSKLLAEAVHDIEGEEDEHLYHTAGWARELWIQSLGMKAVLPPPEEERDVKSMGEAAQAKATRTKGRTA